MCSLGRQDETARLALAVPDKERPIPSLVEYGIGSFTGNQAVVVTHCDRGVEAVTALLGQPKITAL